jgi:hypothetical protein
VRARRRRGGRRGARSRGRERTLEAHDDCERWAYHGERNEIQKVGPQGQSCFDLGPLRLWHREPSTAGLASNSYVDRSITSYGLYHPILAVSITRELQVAIGIEIFSL